MRHQKSRFLALAALSILVVAATASGVAVIKLKVTAEIANVRVKPSIGSNIVRQFPEGTILEADIKEGEWFLVRFEPDETGTASGYVHESLVLPLDEIPLEKIAAPPQPTVSRPPVKTQGTKPPASIPTPKAKVVEPAKDKPAVYEVTDEILAEVEAVSPLFISLWGGGGLTAVGDLNAGAEGLADFYAAQINRSADQSVSPVRAGLTFGGEVGFTIAPGFRIAIGADFLHAGKESTISFSGDSTTSAALTIKPEFSAVPVNFSFLFYPLDFLYLRAGVGYFFAHAEYHYAFSYGETLRDWQGVANAGGAGLIGGIGIDLSLGRGFCLTAELNGRYAKIFGFSGTDTYQDENRNTTSVEEGRLYAYDARTSSRTAYSLVFIRGKKPAESGVENATEACLDLSGISARIGIKIKF